MQMEYPVVFLVDDDPSILKTLPGALAAHGLEVRAYSSAQEFLNNFNCEHGCLVVDLNLPEVNGLELQDELKRIKCSLPIIFITGNGRVPDSVKALRAGAIDFLEKPFKTERLLKSINEAFQQDILNIERKNQQNSMRERVQSLTNREKLILKLLVESDEIPSSKEIARALDISHRTVEHHRSRVLEKIGVSSVWELRTQLKDFDLPD